MTRFPNEDVYKKVAEAATEKKPGDDPAVHPFVNAFANIGAIMGRDLGVVALRAIANQQGMGAILFWSGGQVPDTIRAKIPEDLRGRLYGAMLIPVGAAVPGFNFVDAQVQAAEVTVVDGSKLVAFLRVEGQDNNAGA